MEHPPLDDLSAFVDGELERERRDEVDSHLATCAACRTIASDLTELAGDLRALPRPRPTAAEREHWWNTVEQAMRPLPRSPLLARARARRTPLLAGLAAAAVAIVVVAVAVAQMSGSDGGAVAQPPPTSRTVASFITPTSLLPGDVIDNCRPTTLRSRTVIDGSQDLEAIIGVARQTCGGVVTREQAGSHRPAYSSELASGVASAAACMQAVYDGTDAPLLPLFAQPASYDNQPALVVVFMTTFRTPASPVDVLDSWQAWVMDEASCTPLNVATL